VDDVREFERPKPAAGAAAPTRAPEHAPATPDRLLGNGMLAALGSGAPLPPSLRLSMAGVFGGEDFSDVRIHTDVPTGPALAYTVGNHIAFGPGRYRPDTEAGRALLTHELTHTVQQRHGPVRVQAQLPPGGWRVDPAEDEADRMGRRGHNPWMNINDTDALRILDCVREMGPLHRADCYDIILGFHLPGESLDREPLATRQDLKSNEMTVNAGWVTAMARFFGPKPDPSPAVPAGQRVEVGNSVDGTLVTAARACGAFLLDQIRLGDPTKPFLAPNRTINVEIPTVGQVFRFTRVGAAVVLVEQVGPATALPAAVADAAVTATTFAVGAKTYQLGANWRTNDFAKLTAALGLFPASTLPPAPTIFIREAAPNCAPGTPLTTCNPAWNAKHMFNFAAGRHEITVYDAAFAAGDFRREGTWPALYATLAHEIGHAHDQEALARANARFRNTATGTLEQRKARLLATRSPGGSRFTMTTAPSGAMTITVDANRTSRDGDYRKAALADGLVADPAGALSHGLTDYSETSWSENYAESFSLYVDDPDLLRDLRPTVYAYFASRFPR
jgi:uncharacterized protein DUF4157